MGPWVLSIELLHQLGARQILTDYLSSDGTLICYAGHYASLFRSPYQKISGSRYENLG